MGVYILLYLCVNCFKNNKLHPLFKEIYEFFGLNQFVKEYNHIRPHEALGFEAPASIHNFSTRPFPEKILVFDYNSDMKVLKVT